MLLKPRSTGVFLATALALLAPGAVAQEKPKTQRPQQVVPTGAEDAPAAEPAAARAVQGQLERQLEEMTSRSDEGLRLVKHPNGTQSVDLEGRFMSVAVATPALEGGHAVSCHVGKEAVAQAKHAEDVAAGRAPRASKERAAPPRQEPQPVSTKPSTLEEK